MTLTEMIETHRALSTERRTHAPANYGTPERARELKVGGSLSKLSRAIWKTAEADLSALTTEQVEYIESHVAAPSN